MSCNHPNAAIGRAFCSICGTPLGHRRCSCGTICAAEDKFCGNCGVPLGTINVDSHTLLEMRFNLEQILESAIHDANLSEAQKTRVNQDDIKKLLAKRRKSLK